MNEKKSKKGGMWGFGQYRPYTEATLIEYVLLLNADDIVPKSDGTMGYKLITVPGNMAPIPGQYSPNE